MPEWEYIPIKDLAELLQLNQQTVRNWVNAGQLEAVKVGRRKCIPREAAVALAGGRGWEMPELLTVAQVADLLRLHEMTIRNWIDSGKLPHVWLGERRVRIKRSDLDGVIAAGATTTPVTGISAADFWAGTGPVGELVMDHVAG